MLKKLFQLQLKEPKKFAKVGCKEAWIQVDEVYMTQSIGFVAAEKKLVS